MKYRIVFILLMLAGSLFGQKRVLLENYTSALCGACPLGHLEAAEIAANHPDVLLAFHHSSVDGMANEHSTEWKQFYNILFTPSASVDRIPYNGSSPMRPLNEWNTSVEQQLSTSPFVNLQLSGDYDKSARELSLDVSMLFEEAPPAGELRLNMMILEDSVLHAGFGFDQSNYYDEVEGHPLYGLGQPIYFYPHDHVVRDMVDDTWGTSGVFPSEVELNKPYEHTYDYYVTWSWDQAFVKLIVFVTLIEEGDLSKQRVLNAVGADLFDFIASDNTTVSKSEEVNVFPNPASDLLNIQLPEGAERVHFYTASGQEIWQANGRFSNQNLELNVSNFPPGTYFLQVIRQRETQTIPIILAP
jgi:hypothetical protein